MKTRNCYIAVAAGLLALSGCDRLSDSLGREGREIRRMEREDELKHSDVKTSPADSERQVFAVRVVTAKGMLRSEREQLVKEKDGVVADRVKLASRLGEIADKSDERATVLNLALKDATVNELALKYLGTDFSMQRIEYVDRAKKAIGAERGRRRALEANEKRYRERLEDSEKIQDEQMLTYKAAADGLKREISELEKRQQERQRRLASLRLSSGEMASRDYMRIESEYRQLTTQIKNLRDRYNAMNVGSYQGRLQIDADRARQRSDEDALYERRKADEHVERVKKSSSDVMTEFESATLGKLNSTMAQRQSQAESHLAAVDEKLRYLDSLPKLDGMGVDVLRELKRDFDARMNGVKRW